MMYDDRNDVGSVVTDNDVLCDDGVIMCVVTVV